jgi:hypothetical protein
MLLVLLSVDSRPDDQIVHVLRTLAMLVACGPQLTAASGWCGRRAHFSLLGWRALHDDDEPVNDSRINALLKRAQAFKHEWEHLREKEREKPRDQQQPVVVTIDWNHPTWA